MLLDLVNRIRSERKVLDIQVWVLSRSSRGRPESTSQGRPLNVRLRRPRDGQIGSLGDVLGTLEGDVLGTNICRLGCHWNLQFFNCFSFHYKRSFNKNWFNCYLCFIIMLELNETNLIKETIQKQYSLFFRIAILEKFRIL